MMPLRPGPLGPPGLPSFLHFLSTFPQRSAVARALVLGPLAPLETRSCLIWLASEADDELKLVSSYGGLDEAVERYRTISMKVSYPIITAYEQGRILFSDLPAFMEDNPAVALDRELWEDMVRRTGARSVLDAPIMSGGVPVGSMGLMLGERGPWQPDELALVQGVAAAVGMWLTHPDSGVSDYLRERTSQVPQLDLTPRQLRILALIEEGKSNASIALALGYSESTVKQEIKHVLRVLRVENRHDAVDRARRVGLLT